MIVLLYYANTSPNNLKKMFMKPVFLFLTFISMTALAQTGEDSAKATILNMFNGMRNADTALLRSAFAPAALLQTIIKNKEGVVSVRTQNLSDFIAFIGKPHKEVYDEQIKFEMIRIDDDLAVVWTPYKFYLGEKFSHCGVNSFQMVRINGIWKIQYLIDTRRKDRCD